MKKIYKTFFLCLVSFVLMPDTCFSQTAPPFEWATNCQSLFNGSTSGANYGIAICIDEPANNYTTGCFQGTIFFDTIMLSSPGVTNIFIVSYDSSGILRWAKHLESNFLCQPTDIVYDHAGHIYTTGEFRDSISFDGSNYYVINQTRGYYFARFDTSGNFQWAKIFLTNATSGGLSQIHLSSDDSHNIYVTGQYNDTLRIDNTIINIPATDNFYFAKFDSSGTMQFIKSGFATIVNNLQITSDGQNHIYISGQVQGSVTIQAVNMSGIGVFIAGFDASGNYKWINLAPGNSVNTMGIQTVDNLLYVGGIYNDSMSIGSITFYTPTITHNTFIAQFDTSGTFYWAKRIDAGAWNQIRINSIVATDNYIYVAGEFTNSLIFNGIQYSATPNGAARDPYVAAYDNNGNEIWFKGAGSFHEDYGYDIAIDDELNIYLTGSTHFPAYFDSIMLTDSLAAIGGNNPFDTYIAKLNNSLVLTVPDISLAVTVAIFPNPLTEQSKITFNNPSKEKFVFTLYDITGRIVEAVSTTSNEIVLEKGNKQAGVYLFNLTNEKTGERMNGKIVKE